MIKEAYCSYEVAKLLKEKGFDGGGGDCECHMFYCEYTEERIMPICEIALVPDNEEVFFVPTHQMAMKWLREEKNISIILDDSETPLSYRYVIRRYGINNKYSKVVVFEVKSDTLYIKYEEAVETALKYSLENLI